MTNFVGWCWYYSVTIMSTWYPWQSLYSVMVIYYPIRVKKKNHTNHIKVKSIQWTLNTLLSNNMCRITRRWSIYWPNLELMKNGLQLTLNLEMCFLSNINCHKTWGFSTFGFICHYNIIVKDPCKSGSQLDELKALDTVLWWVYGSAMNPL